ncbi:hypothetical protein CQW23_06978 [Capsicum baccatum]|uniref:Ubiquitin-like protease family profile domain-containing protein n=1 Tax=Capsicum baccatum TaxID=33114 RepID=A0A2G2X4V1_CAPBA|nr:hypothetical protein CQW23_06978 [Capsicum baccatum]
MILMFLVATNFYGKRSDIDWYWEAAYTDKSLSEPLKYVILKDTRQQGPQSNDCGMFVCAFTEYVSHGMFDISSRLFDIVNHRLRYGALLWDYARRKQNDGAISESEATGNVTSKHESHSNANFHLSLAFLDVNYDNSTYFSNHLSYVDGYSKKNGTHHHALNISF